jgi:hypothetical protein
VGDRVDYGSLISEFDTRGLDYELLNRLRVDVGGELHVMLSGCIFFSLGIGAYIGRLGWW